MRDETRLRLSEISVSGLKAKTGVTGVTAARHPPRHTSSHQRVTPARRLQVIEDKGVTPVTLRHTSKIEGSGKRHTAGGVTKGVTGGCDEVWRDVTDQAPTPADWLAAFDERAAILEFDGGYERLTAECLAHDETVAALGPKPECIA